MLRDFEKTIDLFDRLQWDTPEEEYKRIFDLIEKDYVAGDDIRRKQILDLAYKEILAHSLSLYWYLGGAYDQGTEDNLFKGEESESVHNFIRESLRAHEMFYKLLSRRGITIDQFHGRDFIGEAFTVHINPASLLRFVNSKTAKTLENFKESVFVHTATPIKEKNDFAIVSGVQAVDDLSYIIKFRLAMLVSSLTRIAQGQEDERIIGLCRAMERDVNGLISDFDSLEQDFIIFRVREIKEEIDLPELPEAVSAVEEKERTLFDQVKDAFRFDVKGLLGTMGVLLEKKGEKPINEEELDDQIWVICEALRSKADDFGGLLDEYLETQAAQDMADNVGNDQDKV